MIAVKPKLAIGTSEYCIGQSKLVQKPVSASATSLASIGRVYFNCYFASFFRFAQQHIEESRPRRIVDTFSKAVIVNHTVHFQIFNRNENRWSLRSFGFLGERS